MPYISQEKRDDLSETGRNIPTTPGELNYLFTTEILKYLMIKGESYQTYNDIIGALEGAKFELYRRKVANYENLKAQENGDIYE